MTGKTHLAVGTATTLALTRPTTLTDLVVCLTVSALGSLICDIDIKSSKSHKRVKTVLTIGIFLLVAIIFMEYYFSYPIIDNLTNDSPLLRGLAGVTSFLALCSFGKEQPHRSFMHSFLGVLLLSASMYLVLPTGTLYFAVSMLSHMVLDTLNYKKVRFFYPHKKGLSFNLCPAKGHWNDWIFNVALVIILLLGIGFVRMWIV